MLVGGYAAILRCNARQAVRAAGKGGKLEIMQGTARGSDNHSRSWRPPELLIDCPNPYMSSIVTPSPYHCSCGFFEPLILFPLLNDRISYYRALSGSGSPLPVAVTER